jgi:hypothetical protein
MKTSKIFIPFGGVTITQAGFRWGNDDGSESAYTFEELQNVDLERGGSVASIIRFLINTTGDSSPMQLKLQVKRSTGPESEWRDVPVA